MLKASSRGNSLDCPILCGICGDPERFKSVTFRLAVHPSNAIHDCGHALATCRAGTVGLSRVDAVHVVKMVPEIDLSPQLLKRRAVRVRTGAIPSPLYVAFEVLVEIKDV